MLITFSTGILAYSLSDYLYIVLPSVLILLLLAKWIVRMNLTLHHLKVALFTSVLSAIVIYIFLAYFMPRSGLSNCEPDLSGYVISR
jgi:hypothetical protein